MHDDCTEILIYMHKKLLKVVREEEKITNKKKSNLMGFISRPEWNLPYVKYNSILNI